MLLLRCRNFIKLKGGEAMRKTFSIIKPIIIIVVCLMCTVSISFSWFTRQTANSGNAMELSKTMGIRSEGCTAETYYGTEINGQIVYAQQSVTSLENYNVTSEQRIYFKTAVTNNDKADTNISMYMNCNFTSDLTVVVTSPTKTNKAYNGLVDIPVAINMNIPAGATKEITWFVSNTSKEDVLASFNNFYLIYS